MRILLILKLMLLIIFLMTIKCTKDTKQSFFYIKGKSNIAYNGNVYLHLKNNTTNTGSYKIVDSSKVKNGIFSFSGKLVEPQIGFLEFHIIEKGIFTKPFWLENNNIQIDYDITILLKLIYTVP
jgi:hypothetical protein